MDKQHDWYCIFNMGVECATALPPCWKCGWNPENLELHKKRVDKALEARNEDTWFNFRLARSGGANPTLFQGGVSV